MRPFYIRADIEGRKTELAGGTRLKDGSQYTTIYQRNRGEIEEPFTISQRSYEEDGVRKLCTEVRYFGEVIKTHVTEY